MSATVAVWIASFDAWATRATATAKAYLVKAQAASFLAFLVLKSWVRPLLVAARGAARDPAEQHGPAAYRVYVFNEACTGDTGFHRELSPALFDPGTWEQDAKSLTGWTSVRVEVRYVFRHKKYRMVLRAGDACVFPPYRDTTAPACRLPKGVLSARLQGPRGSETDCDVTARVLKYQGPRGDFHAGLGLRVMLRDMFPFDDHADNAVRFSHLRVLDTMARVTDIPYADSSEMTR